MLSMILIELEKIFRKWRTYIGLAAIIVLVALIQTVMFIQGDQYGNMMLQSLRQTFSIDAKLINGYLLAFLVKGLTYVHIPFLVTLVSGDILAGEATGGTIRVLLTKPLTRSKILLAKYITTEIYTLLVVATLALMSYAVSVWLFGPGQLVVINSDGVVVLAKNDVAWRFIYSYLYIFLGLSTVSTLAFFFSSLVENALGPIISTMAVIIVFTALSFLDVSSIRTLKQFFFTTHIAGWRLFFDDPIQWDSIYKSGSILLGHCLGLFGITWFMFTRKDVTT